MSASEMANGEKIPVSVMILTLNEAIHIRPCLRRLREFGDVIVIDSYSNDETKKISLEEGARFFQNKFQGFGSQRNWGMDHADPRYEWILMLDADEQVTPALAQEIRKAVMSAPTEVAAFRLKRRFYLWGQWLKHSSLYPTWVVRLVRRSRVRYFDRGHGESQSVQGSIGVLHEDLIDENLKGMAEWAKRQDRYALKEAEYELGAESSRCHWMDFISHDPLKRQTLLKNIGSRLPLRSFFYFLYSFIFRGGFLEGTKGYKLCRMRAGYYRMIEEKKRQLKKGVVT